MTKLCLSLAAASAAILIVVRVDPDLDLAVARAFFVGPDHFIGNTPAGVVVRYVAWTLPFLTYAALLIGALGRHLRLWPARFGPSRRSILYLTLSLALAPGLIVHATLKEISHRPRPYSVTEFGGKDRFRPYYRWDGACSHNCSFPSGETAAATWMVAPASLAPPPWRALALAAALAFATATGALRMAFGGHFLSDVCGAALITIPIVLALRRLLVRGWLKQD